MPMQAASKWLSMLIVLTETQDQSVRVGVGGGGGEEMKMARRNLTVPGSPSMG